MIAVTYYAIGEVLFTVTHDADRTVLECLTPPDDSGEPELPEPETTTEGE